MDNWSFWMTSLSMKLLVAPEFIGAEKTWDDSEWFNSTFSTDRLVW